MHENTNLYILCSALNSVGYKITIRLVLFDKYDEKEKKHTQNITKHANARKKNQQQITSTHNIIKTIEANARMQATDCIP